MPILFRMRQRVVNGPSIRAIRELLGVSISAFAPRCGVSQGYLSRVELGEKQPSETVRRAIADQLGVPLDAISYVIDVPEEKVA
jgi:transcriptional regulator with XRE-family HTH domain